MEAINPQHLRRTSSQTLRPQRQRRRKGRASKARDEALRLAENKLPSRRDDLESLCYTFIFCYNKQLPWQNICDENYEELVNGNKNKIHEEILLLKKNSYDFYNKLPGEFYCILNYCRKLEFNEKPNYTYLRNIINNYLQNFINI